MTFDELEKKLEEALDSIGSPTSTSEKIDEAIEIMDNLREKYAPTVEMTQEQYQQFANFIKRTDSVQTHAVTLHDKKTEYPEFLNDLVGGVYGRLFLQAWLHPETIKVIGE